MSDLLTLIVPLLGRHKLTDRVLSNLDKQRCEFKIIIADDARFTVKIEKRKLFTK